MIWRIRCGTEGHSTPLLIETNFIQVFVVGTICTNQNYQRYTMTIVIISVWHQWQMERVNHVIKIIVIALIAIICVIHCYYNG